MPVVENGGSFDAGDRYAYVAQPTSVSITVRNAGLGPLSFGDVTISSIVGLASASVVTSPARRSLRAGEQATFVVEFYGVEDGPFSFDISLKSADLDTPDFTATVFGVNTVPGYHFLRIAKVPFEQKPMLRAGHLTLQKIKATAGGAFTFGSQGFEQKTMSVNPGAKTNAAIRATVGSFTFGSQGFEQKTMPTAGRYSNVGPKSTLRGGFTFGSTEFETKPIPFWP